MFACLYGQLLERFKWARRVTDRLGGDMGIARCCTQFGVTKQHLNDPNIRPRFQQVRGKAVPQGMQRGWL